MRYVCVCVCMCVCVCCVYIYYFLITIIFSLFYISFFIFFFFVCVCVSFMFIIYIYIYYRRASQTLPVKNKVTSSGFSRNQYGTDSKLSSSSPELDDIFFKLHKKETTQEAMKMLYQYTQEHPQVNIVIVIYIYIYIYSR